MTNIRVIRVLEYTGPEDWVKDTLCKSYVTSIGVFPATAIGQIKVIELYEDLTYRHSSDPTSCMNIRGYYA